jgi:Peptidase family M48
MALDPQVATAALIDALGAQTLAKAAAYTAGKHWLLLWDLVVTGVATWAIVRSGVLDRVEARLARRGVNARAFVVGVIFFLVTDRLFPRFARAFGSPVPISDPRGLPVILFMVALIMAFATPVMNTLTRMSESEADRHSLETVNLPDALATALVKTAEYRDPRPHRLQEILFYTHPAVERRVLAAMQWKAAGPAASLPARQR